MKDTLNKRSAVLANNAIDKTPTKKIIEISITSAIPLLVIDKDIVSASTLNTIYNAALSAVDNKNYLLGINSELTDGVDPDRYKLLSRITSPITGNKALLYYDTVFKDILLLPNIGSYDPDNQYTTSLVLQVKAYSIGAYLRNVNISDCSTLPYNENTKYDMPDIKTDILTVTTSNLIDGLEPGFKTSNGVLTLTGDGTNTLVRGSSNATTLVKLGKISDIFNSNNLATIKVPVFLAYQYAIDKVGVRDLPPSNTGPDDLYISINF